MTRSLALGCAMTSVFALLGACSSTADPANTAAGTAGSSGAATAAAAGSSGSGATSAGAPGTGGSSAGAASTSAGAPAGGVGSGTGGATVGGASTGTAGASAGAGGTATGVTPPMGPFTCTQYIGAYLSMEWWNQGFQQEPGIEDGKWQLKWHHHGTIGNWGDPNSPFWGDEGDPQDDSKGAPIQSACTTNSKTPDRIVMLIIEWDLITQADWVTQIEKIVTNLKTKYPSAKRIELMTTVRVAGNLMCNPNASYGPGANASAGREDCYIPPYADAAIAQVIAAHPDILAAGPQIEAPKCGPTVNGPHLGGDNDKLTAKAIAAYYAKRP
jgi:hypothetical protein